ncbi:hypothetical protein NEOLEDRAFT_1232303 [Neolentinus lepideus HHB14362 ss-1]|uniref:Uncharacterized protein n=1 Tax=Neolentinus lepideus HHB14362 ss-1 TaxID=1314782 RepID=A0A165NKT0_9AGAM|nr:hypothetical protein NEOLEDRAFT_1232303 [Neolentinus lepideus HHB14362 ss-1]
MKRWWTVELTARRKELRVLGNEAHKYCYVPDHPSHHIFRQAEQNYQDAIRKQKSKHWEEWMTHVSGKDIWTANKFISGPVGDGGKTRVPTLKIKDAAGQIIGEATTNEDRAQQLANSFFPQPPAHSLVDPDTAPPLPISKF